MKPSRAILAGLLFASGAVAAAACLAIPDPPSGECPDAGLYEGMLAYWSFDDVDGGVLPDECRMGYDGTLLGDGGLPKVVPGIDGGSALRFSKVDRTAVRIEKTGDLRGSGSLTVSAWVSPRASVGDNEPAAGLVSSTGGMAYRGWRLYLKADAQSATFGFWIAEGRCTTVTIEKTLASPPPWVHVVGVYDSEKPAMALYVDGEKVTLRQEYFTCQDAGDPHDASVPSQQYNREGGHVNIGRDSSDDFLPNPDNNVNADIDEVRIFGRALSDEEVAALP